MSRLLLEIVFSVSLELYRPKIANKMLLKAVQFTLPASLVLTFCALVFLNTDAEVKILLNIAKSHFAGIVIF